MKRTFQTSCLILIILFFGLYAYSQKSFKVLGFYTAKNDLAHISFVHEANKWFENAARENHFTYDSTNDWTKLNSATLARYNVIVFFDTRPEQPEQRDAFEKYMKKGGAWMGFHFAGFALNNSDFPQNWDWYHNEFLGAGQYKSNTWHPTSAVLKVEDRNHPVLKNLPDTFSAAPNEWYSWENDLTKNKDIKILLSVDSSSFPLGTGPKQHEIWHSGYYPIVWTNKKYRMIYFNMGHNDIDYDGGTNKELSFQFANKTQNRLILNSLFWLANRKR